MTLREFLDNLTKEHAEHLKVAVIGPVASWSPVLTSVTNNAKFSSMFSKYVNIHVPNLDHDGLGLIELINNSNEIGLKLPDNLQAFTSVQQTAKDADILLITTPVNELVDVLDQLSGEIKSDAFALSLTHELRKNDYGYVELVCETIKDRLGIPCYTLAGYDQLLPLRTNERQQATIGCNFPAHATILAKLINHNDLQLNVCNDIEAVELCGALKDLVEIGAGICNGLHLDDNAKTRIMLEGLNEMIMFFKTFHAERNLVDMFAKCGVPDIFNIEHMNQNMLVAQNFVVTNKPLDQIERECLQGHKMSGASTAESVHHMLKFHNIDKKFPLFTTIHRVCSNLMRAREIVDVTSVNLIGEVESANYKKDIFKIIRNKVQQQYDQLPRIVSGTSHDLDSAPHQKLMPLNSMTTRRMSTKGGGGGVIPFEIIYKALSSPNKKETKDGEEKALSKFDGKAGEAGSAQNDSGRKHMLLVNIQLLKGNRQNPKQSGGSQMKMLHYWGSGDLNPRRRGAIMLNGTRNVGSSGGGGGLANDDGWLMGMKRIIESPTEHAPYKMQYKLESSKSSPPGKDNCKNRRLKDNKKAASTSEDNEMEPQEFGGFKEKIPVSKTPEVIEESPIESPGWVIMPRASSEDTGSTTKHGGKSGDNRQIPRQGTIQVSGQNDQVNDETKTQSKTLGYKHSKGAVLLSSDELAKKLVKEAKLNHFEIAPIDIDMFTENSKMCKATAIKLVAEAEAQARAELAKIQLKKREQAMAEIMESLEREEHETEKKHDVQNEIKTKAVKKAYEAEVERHGIEALKAKEIEAEEASEMQSKLHSEIAEDSQQPHPPQWYMEIKQKQKEIEDNASATELQAKELCDESEEQLRTALHQLKLDLKAAESANILPKNELLLIKSEIKQLEHELKMQEAASETGKPLELDAMENMDKMEMVSESRENKMYKNEVKEIENTINQHENQSPKAEKKTGKQKDHWAEAKENENQQKEMKGSEKEHLKYEMEEAKEDLFEEIKRIASNKEIERRFALQFEEQKEKKQASLMSEHKKSETKHHGTDGGPLEIQMKPPRMGRTDRQDQLVYDHAEEFHIEKEETKKLLEQIARNDQNPLEFESETIQLIENQKTQEHESMIDYKKIREKELAQREQRRQERNRRKADITEVKEEKEEKEYQEYKEQTEEQQQQETESKLQQQQLLEEKLRNAVKVMTDHKASKTSVEMEAGEIENTAQKLESHLKQLESETKQLEHETKQIEKETKLLENETKALEMEMRDALEELEQQQVNETKQQRAETKLLQKEMREALEELEKQNKLRSEFKQNAMEYELKQVENEKKMQEAEMEMNDALDQLEREQAQQEMKQTAINTMKAEQVKSEKTQVKIEQQMKKLETVAQQWDNFMNECLEQLEKHKENSRIKQSTLNLNRVDKVKKAVENFKDSKLNEDSKQNDTNLGIKVEQVKEVLENLEKEHSKEQLKESGINMKKVEQVKKALKEYEQSEYFEENTQLQAVRMAEAALSKTRTRMLGDLNVLDEEYTIKKELNTDLTAPKGKTSYEADEEAEYNRVADESYETPLPKEDGSTKLEIEQIKSELLLLEMEMEQSKKTTPTQEDITQIREDLQLIQMELKQLESKLSQATINELRAEAQALDSQMVKKQNEMELSDKEQWWQEPSRREINSKIKLEEQLRNWQDKQFEEMDIKESYKAHRMHKSLAAEHLAAGGAFGQENVEQGAASEEGKRMPPGPMKRAEQLEAAAAASSRAAFAKHGGIGGQKGGMPSLKLRKCCQPVADIHLPDVKYLHTNAVRQRMATNTPSSSATNKVAVPGIIQNKLLGISRTPLHTHYIKFSGNKSRLYFMQKAIKATLSCLKQLRK